MSADKKDVPEETVPPPPAKFDPLFPPGNREFRPWDPDGTGTFHGPPAE